MASRHPGTFRNVPARSATGTLLYLVAVHEPPPIEPRGQLPPYQQIAEWLRGRIESGDLAPGAVLPSEKDLMGLFGVGRNTARRTMAKLREEGVIYTIPQRGSYVTRR